MIEIKADTFKECLEIADKAGGNKHLILENGFSMSLFPNIFNYKTLAEQITSVEIKQLFASLKTNDFEYVMRELTNALEIAKLYSEGAALAPRLTQDLDKLKITLIDVITHSHPANPRAITDAQYNSCYEFLKNFESGKKYTFNYDLILYWVYMHFLDNKEKKLESDDRFRHPKGKETIVTWSIGREHKQSLYYLHGAMHIFSDSSEIEKYKWINSRKSISEQVQESIRRNILFSFPKALMSISVHALSVILI